MPKASSNFGLMMEIGNFLVEQQFEAVQTPRIMGFLPAIEAISGSCRMLIVDIDPHGADQDLIRNLRAWIN